MRDALRCRQERYGVPPADDGPTDEIGAAWGCKELLRQLLAETDAMHPPPTVALLRRLCPR
ncbi:MAG: hypothetical protein M3228_07640 [Actinomycetota bacterium]|nr:hypothetical protein [Actinomycetota bacterium]